jgi:hypothetical protein
VLARTIDIAAAASPASATADRNARLGAAVVLRQCLVAVPSMRAG